MPVQPEPTAASVAVCWCCGTEYPESELVRLGQHPEVGVCLRCAWWLQRRAMQRYDERHSSPGARMRGGIRAVREVVIRKGWHERGLVGVLLRWLDRHLP
jgi:hypothetical protein